MTLPQFTDEPLEIEDDVVKIKVGKYKVEVSKYAFDKWCVMVQAQVGNNKDDITSMDCRAVTDRNIVKST